MYKNENAQQQMNSIEKQKLISFAFFLFGF